jgi:hypothetical protein
MTGARSWLVTRNAWWISRGPSIEIPTSTFCSRKNAARSGLRFMPSVWIVSTALWPMQVLLGELGRAAEERQPHQRWPAALPRHLDHRRTHMSLDELTHVRLQHLVGHAEPAARIRARSPDHAQAVWAGHHGFLTSSAERSRVASVQGGIRLFTR